MTATQGRVMKCHRLYLMSGILSITLYDGYLYTKHYVPRSRVHMLFHNLHSTQPCNYRKDLDYIPY